MTDFSERCRALESSSAKLKSYSSQKRKPSIAQIKAPMLEEGMDILNPDQNAVKPTVQVSQTNICQICQGAELSRICISRCCCSSRLGQANETVFQLSTIVSHDQSMPKQVSLPNLSWKASFLVSPRKAE